MDIKDLNKTQLILLTLLITFVVSIATGIITVSLMQQMPKSVPQTINNVIQRTIEKVTTVPAPTTATPASTDTTESNKGLLSSIGDNSNVTVSIYPADDSTLPAPQPVIVNGVPTPVEVKPLGDGIIISDIGLILVDSSILTDKDVYKVTLNKIDFDATVLKKFTNGFAILKLSQRQASDTTTSIGTSTSGTTPAVDNKQ